MQPSCAPPDAALPAASTLQGLNIAELVHVDDQEEVKETKEGVAIAAAKIVAHKLARKESRLERSVTSRNLTGGWPGSRG